MLRTSFFVPARSGAQALSALQTRQLGVLATRLAATGGGSFQRGPPRDRDAPRAPLPFPKYPFPESNPTAVNPLRVGNKTKELIYNLYISDPARYTDAALATKYGFSVARVRAILRLKHIEHSMKAKGWKLNEQIEAKHEAYFGTIERGTETPTTERTKLDTSESLPLFVRLDDRRTAQLKKRVKAHQTAAIKAAAAGNAPTNKGKPNTPGATRTAGAGAAATPAASPATASAQVSAADVERLKKNPFDVPWMAGVYMPEIRTPPADKPVAPAAKAAGGGAASASDAAKQADTKEAGQEAKETKKPAEANAKSAAAK